MTPIRRFLAAALALGMAATATAQEARGYKIATVDMQELFKQYYRTNEAQKQLNIEKAKIGQEANTRQARIREIEANLSNVRKQIEDPSISEARKATLMKDWQVQQNEGIALDRERNEFINRRQRALNEKMVQRMKGILEEIRQLVEEQAKKDDYDFVFDKSGLSTSQVPLIVWSKDATDLTASLLKDLNKDAPPESLIPADEVPEISPTDDEK
jgi:outer membrane protein